MALWQRKLLATGETDGISIESIQDMLDRLGYG